MLISFNDSRLRSVSLKVKIYLSVSSLNLRLVYEELHWVFSYLYLYQKSTPAEILLPFPSEKNTSFMLMNSNNSDDDT